MFHLFLFLLTVGFLVRLFNRKGGWWFQVRKFKKVPSNGQGCVLFTGSSSIRFWSSLEQDMAPLPAINRGFGGSQMSHLTYYFEYIFFGISPRAIVVYSGENDLAWNKRKSPEIVLSDFQAFVETVQSRFPQALIYVISIKIPPRHQQRWPVLQQASELIRQFVATRRGITFIDANPSLLDATGKPRQDLFLADGIHLLPEGYRRWTEIIKPILLRDLG